MKNTTLKKILIALAVLTAIALSAFASIAKEESISLNSPTTFPVDI